MRSNCVLRLVISIVSGLVSETFFAPCYWSFIKTWNSRSLLNRLKYFVETFGITLHWINAVSSVSVLYCHIFPTLQCFRKIKSLWMITKVHWIPLRHSSGQYYLMKLTSDSSGVFCTMRCYLRIVDRWAHNFSNLNPKMWPFQSIKFLFEIVPDGHNGVYKGKQLWISLLICAT